MCLTVGRQSRDHRPLSRDPSVTFFKKFSNCWKRPKNVVWQSTDGRVTSDHCRVTVQRLFSKFPQIAWNVEKTLFDSRPTVAWPQPLTRDRSATFFKILANRLKRPKNVVWQSADGRVTSTTDAWPFSDFFQNLPKSLETSKKRCLTVSRRSRDLRPLSRDRSATFFKKFSNCLKRRKNVVWRSADGRVTSDHCRVTVQWLFSKIFPIAWNIQKRCLTVGRRSRDLNHCRVTVQQTFFKKFSICLKRRKNVVWQSADGRVTSDQCRVTVQWLFSKNFLIAWNIQKRCDFSLNSSNCLIPRKTVVWQSADGRVTSDLVGTSKKCCLKVSGLSRDGPATLFPWFFSYGFTYCFADVYLVSNCYFKRSSSVSRLGMAAFIWLTDGLDSAWLSLTKKSCCPASL